jgi:hypothetical protein
MSYYDDIKIEDDSISIMNHKITIEDVIDQTYYTVNMAIVEHWEIMDELYINKLNETDKNKWYNFRFNIYETEIKRQNSNKPIYPNFEKTNNNKPTYLSIYKFRHLYNCNNYSYNDTVYINYININDSDKTYWDINSYYMFMKSLKFKIQQERITRNVRKNLELANFNIKLLENKLQQQITNQTIINNQMETKFNNLFYIIGMQFIMILILIFKL